MIVEREAAIRLIEGALDAASAGAGEVVLVEGRPGSGKTALLHHAAERARKRGIAVADLPAEEHARFPRSPTVLVVDDLDTLDEASLERVLAAALARGSRPSSMVLALRIGAGGSRIDALRAAPGLRRVALGPLTADGVLRVCRHRLPGATSAFAATCFALTGGVPRDLTMLLDAAGDHAVGPDDDGAVTLRRLRPATHRRAVAEELAARSPEARALARAAAVLGLQSTLDQAARVADLGDGAGHAAQELQDAGILAIAPSVVFASVLTHAAVYAGIPPVARVDAHGRAAGLLIVDGTDDDAAAAHLLLAEPGVPGAGRCLTRVARRAQRRGAAATTARLLARALREPMPESVRTETLVELGIAESHLGRAEAEEHLEAALDLAETPAEIARASRTLAFVLASRNRTTDASVALRRATEVLEGRDAELALRLRGELAAVTALEPGRDTEAESIGATPVGSDRTPGERLALAGKAHERSISGAAAPEITDLVVRALGHGALLREQTADSPIVYLLVYAAYRADRLDLAYGILGSTEADARARGSMVGLNITTAVRGHLALLCGRLPEAEADARVSLEAEAEVAIGGLSMRALAVAVLAECLLEREDPEAAHGLFLEHALDGPLPELLPYLWARVARGRTRIAAGRRQDGLADLLSCGAAPMDARTAVTLLWRTSAARTLAADGLPDRARALADEELAAARELAVARPLGVALVAAGELRGGAEGLPLLEEAVRVLEPSTARLEHARALVALGAALRRANRRKDAHELLAAGLELADVCGSVLLVRRAREELSAIGARPRRTARSGTDALTGAERRIAELAASGLSNPEIAQQLFVTRKTVEMHLSNAYRKLGVSGRKALPGALR